MSFVSPLKSEELSQSSVNSGKKNVIIERLSQAPWWLLIILLLALFFVIEVQDRSSYQDAWAEVQKGISTTIRVTIIAYSLALVMGLTLALLRRKSNSLIYNFLVYHPVTAWIELIRGIPTLVLLLYMYLAFIPESIKFINNVGEWLQTNGLALLGLADQMVNLKLRDIEPEYRATIALAISYSAFLSEIFRAGIESIDRGQREAATSLGMSRWQVMALVVLPQAIRNVLPPLGNDFIAMLKESSLVSVVGVEDITRTGRNFNAATFTIFPGYSLIAFTYLIMTLSLSLLVKGLEQYLNRSRER